MSKKEKSAFEPEIPHVPAGWAVAPFQRVVSVVSDAGKRIKQRDYMAQGKIPVIDQGQDFIGGYTDEEGLAFDGELPVVLFGDHTRAIKFVDKRFAVGAEGIKILKPASLYNPKFFYYLLTSLQIPSRGYSRHFQFLKKFSLPIAPMTQQTRIVAEIDKQFSRLDEAVANLKRVKANLKRYKAAVLKAAVEGKLTEEWRKQHPDVEPAAKLLERILEERRANWQGRGKYKEPVAPDTSGLPELPELPEEWVWASVEQLTSELMNGFGKRSQAEGRSRIVLRLADISDGKICFDDVRRINCTSEEIFKYKLGKSDLLVLRVNGSPDLVGRFILVEQDPKEVLFCDHFIRVRCVLPKLANWLRMYSEVERFRKFIELNKVSSAGQNTISQGTLTPFAIPVPPIAEQHQIVAEVERRLSIIAGAEAQVDANLRRADRLRQSILKQAFSGQLVPQVPHDEPASVLLERIRNGVGAIHESPSRAMRKQNRAIHESPLRKSPQPIKPVGAIHELPLHAPTANSDFKSLDAVISAILDYMQPDREYSRADLADALGLSTGRWNAAIQELKRRGKVRQVGERRGTKYELFSVK